jgi:two-component system OmpR family sensor kinase
LQLQLLERARDEPERDLATSRLRDAIERATHLVGQLLTLARNEPEGMAESTSTVPLGAIAGNAVGDVQLLAQQRRIDIRLEVPAEISVKGDAEALRILVRNLLDNAVRYSPEGSLVQVRLSSRPGQAVLEVTDAGPGIAAADRSRAFARFYRAPGVSAGGTGLGLAIVKAIAQRHGAEVTLDQAQPQGLRVEVVFPVASGAP